MKSITDAEIIGRIRYENPWWNEPHEIDPLVRSMRHRSYFDLLHTLVIQRDPRRAVILMGPRRVGKTVMLFQAIQRIIDNGTAPNSICYLDLQTPTYSGMSLEKLLNLGKQASGCQAGSQFYMIFDEIQYARDWEVQLKNAVDSFRRVKFVASGSAAAALRMKSAESGAGRFTDFLLPPVTFLEYLELVGIGSNTLIRMTNESSIEWEGIEEINKHFLDYLNFGGYPEAILSETIKQDPGRFIRSDIIEKVLTRDLPSLYGIHDVRELNHLFTTLAYNTGQEVSLEHLSQKSGVVKPTIKRYIDYLEAAFLIKVVHRVDNNAKRFKKANFFKVYLTNPCMRSALFAPLDAESEHVGSLVETAVFSQWLHSDAPLHYGRWQNGEVDLIDLDPGTFKPRVAVEIRWTDSCVQKLEELKSLKKFLRDNPKCPAFVTTRSESCTREIEGRSVLFLPSAVYCYYIGWLMIRKRLGALPGLKIQRQNHHNPTPEL